MCDSGQVMSANYRVCHPRLACIIYGMCAYLKRHRRRPMVGNIVPIQWASGKTYQQTTGYIVQGLRASVRRHHRREPTGYISQVMRIFEQATLASAKWHRLGNLGRWQPVLVLVCSHRSTHVSFGLPSLVVICAQCLVIMKRWLPTSP